MDLELRGTPAAGEPPAGPRPGLPPLAAPPATSLPLSPAASPFQSGAASGGEGAAAEAAALSRPAAHREDAARPPLPEQGRGPSIGRSAGMLLLGLVPVLGVFFCLFWGFGTNAREAKGQNLAKAMLCLHGAALALAILGLCVWVAKMSGMF